MLLFLSKYGQNYGNRNNFNNGRNFDRNGNNNGNRYQNNGFNRNNCTTVSSFFFLFKPNSSLTVIGFVGLFLYTIL